MHGEKLFFKEFVRPLKWKINLILLFGPTLCWWLLCGARGHIDTTWSESAQTMLWVFAPDGLWYICTRRPEGLYSCVGQVRVGQEDGGRVSLRLSAWRGAFRYVGYFFYSSHSLCRLQVDVSAWPCFALLCAVKSDAAQRMPQIQRIVRSDVDRFHQNCERDSNLSAHETCRTDRHLMPATMMMMMMMGWVGPSRWWS